MIRTPLRPLARILDAREKGENPDAIERENLRLRHEAMRDRSRQRAEGRLLIMGFFFFAAFAVVGARMGLLSATDPTEPRANSNAASIIAQRADITDREGRILATNLVTHSLYAQPQTMIDPVHDAKELAKIFPDLDAKQLEKDFTSTRKFLWIKKKISPEQMQQVHDIGDPGLLFGPREMRIYPNGKLASHILGGATFGREGVHSAEVIGTAGVEKTFDSWLRDPANGGQPLQLSIDLTVQAAMEEILAGGMSVMNAKGASAVLMNVHTGEVVAMASLPNFDPNNRPAPIQGNDPSLSPLFNRAVQGVYELGSVFKIFVAAQVIDLGLGTPDTLINTKTPLVWGKYKIRDFHNYGDTNTITTLIEKSSNVGAAHLALMLKAEQQQSFLASLGLLAPTPIEMVEAETGRPIVPKRWPDITRMTVAYGHGLSVSPLHLAAAYCTIVNGGTKVTPTILKQNRPEHGPRIISEKTSQQMRKIMRLVVSHGTASFGDVPGYMVGGKTGSADKAKPTGGYYEDKVIGTFAAAFPMNDPQYVLITTLDEAHDDSSGKSLRTAGWTAVPVAGEIIRRVAPLLGLRPEVEGGKPNAITLARN